MPKCRVTEANGYLTTIEADKYDVLLDSGYVVLWRRIKPEDPQSAMTTSAILYRPQSVVFDSTAEVQGEVR